AVTVLAGMVTGAPGIDGRGFAAARSPKPRPRETAPPPAPETTAFFQDDFETGDFSKWSSVTSDGGTAEVQSQLTAGGSYAARLEASATSGSRAFARKVAPQTQSTLKASGDFNITAEGPSGSDVPVFKLFDQGGVPVVVFYRQNVYGRLWVKHSGGYHATSASLPLNTWAHLSVQGSETGSADTVKVTKNGSTIYETASADLGSAGFIALQIGNDVAAQSFSLAVDNVLSEGAASAAGTPEPTTDDKLLIADHLSKRLLITDLNGRLVWSFHNPTGRTGTSGPLGVRWMPGNQILATFGTGEVGLIDVATRSWVWKVTGFNNEAFQSPYDAELLPDGNLAVALRFNEKGRVSVYNRETGEQVFRDLLSDAHSLRYRSPEQSYNSDLPTLLMGGWGAVKEVTYQPGGEHRVSWTARTEYTHDAMVVDNDELLTTEGYYIQRINRQASQIWRKSTPDENRRITTGPSGEFIYSVGEGDRIEFRTPSGDLIRQWSFLSDGTSLDYPYGIQLIRYPE
ncbi:MAG: hypothetical protein ACRDIA_07105, partial [Actinomycetota bacterium]